MICPTRRSIRLHPKYPAPIPMWVWIYPGKAASGSGSFHREAIKTRREAMPFSLLLPHIFCVRKV